MLLNNLKVNHESRLFWTAYNASVSLPLSDVFPIRRPFTYRESEFICGIHFDFFKPAFIIFFKSVAHNLVSSCVSVKGIKPCTYLFNSNFLRGECLFVWLCVQFLFEKSLYHRVYCVLKGKYIAITYDTNIITVREKTKRYGMKGTKIKITQQCLIKILTWILYKSTRIFEMRSLRLYPHHYSWSLFVTVINRLLYVTQPTVYFRNYFAEYFFKYLFYYF